MAIFQGHSTYQRKADSIMKSHIHLVFKNEVDNTFFSENRFNQLTAELKYKECFLNTYQAL